MYITKEDVKAYNAEFDLTETETTRLINAAEDAVNSLTYYRIPAKGGLQEFPEFVQRQVKKACCEQVVFLQLYGDMVNSPLKNYGINGVSISLSEDAVVQRSGVTVSRQVYNLLLPTNLMYRGMR